MKESFWTLGNGNLNGCSKRDLPRGQNNEHLIGSSETAVVALFNAAHHAITSRKRAILC
jgi:hypothetical protein